MAGNQIKLFCLSVCFAPILNLAYADTNQENATQTYQEVYEETKGLWYLSAFHTHWAMPTCQCEAQLLTEGDSKDDKNYPYDFTRFCITENGNKKIYTLPIKTSTQKENHWLLSLHNMSLGWLIDKMKPMFIDLNFHASWMKDEGNTHSMRCHSEHSRAQGNNNLCENTGQRLEEPNVILVGDNPSKKSDFTMLLSREPALDHQTHKEAMDSINQIYKIAIEKKPGKKPKTINWKETKACTIKLNQFILENMNNDPIVRLDNMTKLTLGFKLEEINDKLAQRN